MKNRRLLVRTSCTTRNFYLFRPTATADWHIKFIPPRWVRERLGGKLRVVRTTRTKEMEPAKRIAAQIIESYWKDAGASADEKGLLAQSSTTTVGELVDRYKKCAKERSATVKSNANALLLMVRTVRGGDPKLKPVTVLDGELIREFERLRAAAEFGASTASYVRQARSVVALPKMGFYKEMKLPDLTEFRVEPVESPEVADIEPLDMNAMAAMEAATPKLAQEDPAVYVAHLMFAYLGMRNIEILHARKSWVVDGRIGIINRPEENFKPKGRSAWLPIAPDVLKEIERFEDRTTEYLVPGKTRTDRHKVIYRRHSKWVSTWIKDRRKTSYELRRFAASRLLDMGATLFQARDFLRHGDVQTTQRWYAYRLQNRELPTIAIGELLPTAS